LKAHGPAQVNRRAPAPWPVRGGRRSGRPLPSRCRVPWLAGSRRPQGEGRRARSRRGGARPDPPVAAPSGTPGTIHASSVRPSSLGWRAASIISRAASSYRRHCQYSLGTCDCSNSWGTGPFQAYCQFATLQRRAIWFNNNTSIDRLDGGKTSLTCRVSTLNWWTKNGTPRPIRHAGVSEGTSRDSTTRGRCSGIATAIPRGYEPSRSR